MPAASYLRRSSSTVLVETALLAPVLGLVLLGAFEIRHAFDVEARVASAARRVAHAGLDVATATASERKALSQALAVAEASIDITVAEDRDESVVVKVPYAQLGSPLAFLWPSASVIANSATIH